MIDKKETSLIAFYLPQFHPIPENNSWWGEGFTEWTNVTQATPKFEGHYQPHIPADLGFYDLRLDETRAAQAALARKYGITAFCYHYYWFKGKRLLERPLEEMLSGRAPDLPFCLCWANENWTRRWNGDDREVLIAQEHSAEDDVALFQDLARYFSDSRYVRINGRPLFLVYRVDILPNPAETVARWRAEAQRLGVDDPYLCAVQSFGIEDATQWGFDASVEFPPHGIVAGEYSASELNADSDFKGRIFSFPDTVRFAMDKAAVIYPRFRCVMPSWDNTARRRNFGHCYHASSPLLYRAWLADAIAEAQSDPLIPEPIVFINAWNEWAEGCHLEPDLRYGKSWLEATFAAKKYGQAPLSVKSALLDGQLSSSAADSTWDCVELGGISFKGRTRWQSQFYLWLRLKVNRRQKLKRILRPIARLFRWLD